jgi:phosphoribosyl-ATP pyrophosphohydrolase
MSQQLPNQVDLSNFSLVELKALMYDLNVLLVQTQQNLKIVSNELELRLKKLAEETKNSNPLVS